MLLKSISRKVTASVAWLFRMKRETIGFNIGWDTLHPFAPYSHGGIPRNKFLELVKKKKIKRLTFNEDVRIATYGSNNPSMSQFLEVHKRSEFVKEWFDSFK
jgi:hypothetical protein